MSKRIVSVVQAIIDSVDKRLPDHSADHARELLEHDEWGEALSLICTQLHEYDIPVPAAVAASIKDAASLMNMDSSVWEQLTIEERS